MAVRGTLQRFTASGKSVGEPQGGWTGTGLTVGVKLEDGRIIKGPRPAVDLGLRSGGRVRVLNAAAMSGRTARRHGGLGFGPVGDKTY
jgi:hypothetical protein